MLKLSVRSRLRTPPTRLRKLSQRLFLSPIQHPLTQSTVLVIPLNAHRKHTPTASFLFQVTRVFIQCETYLRTLKHPLGLQTLEFRLGLRTSPAHKIVPVHLPKSKHPLQHGISLSNNQHMSKTRNSCQRPGFNPSPLLETIYQLSLPEFQTRIRTRLQTFCTRCHVFRINKSNLPLNPYNPNTPWTTIPQKTTPGKLSSSSTPSISKLPLPNTTNHFPTKDNAHPAI